MSVLKTLSAEHHLIRDFIDKVQVAAEVYGWGERPSEEFFELVFEFADSFIETYHHIKEEEVLFPVLVEKLEGELDSQFTALQNQHKKADLALKEMRRCLKGYVNGNDTQTSIFWRSLGDYNSFLRAHLNRENHVFFPWVERKLNKKEQKEMEQRFKVEEAKLGQGFLEDCKKTLEDMTNVLEKDYGVRYRHLLDSVASKRVNYQAA